MHSLDIKHQARLGLPSYAFPPTAKFILIVYARSVGPQHGTNILNTSQSES
uniref:Uncharacterized protein n=1 Tax=viral metagenome TaxID=1070528 RepID=A0A6C0F264_9ZZZZ